MLKEKLSAEVQKLSVTAVLYEKGRLQQFQIKPIADCRRQ